MTLDEAIEYISNSLMAARGRTRGEDAAIVVLQGLVDSEYANSELRALQPEPDMENDCDNCERLEKMLRNFHDCEYESQVKALKAEVLCLKNSQEGRAGWARSRAAEGNLERVLAACLAYESLQDLDPKRKELWANVKLAFTENP